MQEEADAIVGYAVVHGTDPIIDRCQSASECLERVLVLEAQAEPGIRILDPTGAEIRLGRLEALHKKEVERKYLAQAPTPSGADTRARLNAASSRVINRTPLATALAALATLGVLIGSLGHHRGEQAGAKHEVQAHAKGAPDTAIAPRSKANATEQVGEPSAAPAPRKEEHVKIEAMQPRTYRIMGGDTLSGIAEKFYHDPGRWRDIAMANPRLDPRRLRIGEIINLPQPVKLAPAT